MKKVFLPVLALLAIFSGCITIDMGGSASKKPSVVTFTVSPSSINSGEAAIISWEVENASSVAIDPGMPTLPSAGADKVAPATTTTYTLSATNKNGTTRSTVVLNVGGSAPASNPQSGVAGQPVITTFSAAPSTVSVGSPSVLTWSVSNADGARISGVGTVATGGSTTVYPSTSTTYVLEAYNGAGTVQASTMVAVTGSTAPPVSGTPPTILSFSVSPSAISSGGSALLSWNTLNATGVNISGVGPVSTSGSLTITPSATMTLTLVAQNSSGSNYATTTITVNSGSTPAPSGSRPGVVTFSISPSSITAGATATLTWEIYNATSVYFDHGIGNVSSAGSATIAPMASTTYTLTAQNTYGTTVASRNITVTPVVTPTYTWPTISDFRCSNTTVVRGNQAKLYWTVSNADSIYIDNGIGNVGPSGTTYIYPTATTTYTIMATNGANTVSQSVTVVVTP